MLSGAASSLVVSKTNKWSQALEKSRLKQIDVFRFACKRGNHELWHQSKFDFSTAVHYT